MVYVDNFLEGKKVLVTGGSGFLGSHVVGLLKEKKPDNISVPRSKDHDLRLMEDCEEVVKGQDMVIHLAAKAGGIGLNMERPAELYYDNVMINTQLMEAARRANVAKFISIGSVCAYPKFTPVPFKEEGLWDGYPEETNAPYGLAKRMMLVQSQAYRKQYGFNSIYLLIVNLYGPEDNFDLHSSHVIPALIRKIHEANKNNEDKIVVWGTGSASREFLYVEDAARAIVTASERYNKPEPINIGSGQEITIKGLVDMLADIMGFKGEVVWDRSKPDGQPKRCLDTTKADKEFGFKAKVSLEEGLKRTIEWYGGSVGD